MRSSAAQTRSKQEIVNHDEAGDPVELGSASARSSTPGNDVGAFSGDPNFMASLARGLVVIRAFAQHPGRQTIAQISQRTGIPRAAVRRCLYTLNRLGYVATDARYFSLAPQILALGHAYLSSTPLVVSALPFLDKVNANVNESCSLAILDDLEILYVARSTKTTRIMSIDLKPGSRLPAYCSSMGRVLLANLPTPQLKDALTKIKLKSLTERTVTSKEKLSEILETVRDRGYAIIDQELEIGLRSIAVPVKDGKGRVVAAMNVGAQAVHLSVREMETEVLPHLRAAAQELGTLLYPN